MITAPTVGQRVMLAEGQSHYAVPDSDTGGTIVQVDTAYGECYVTWDSDHSTWHSNRSLQPERPLTAETADTLERFQRLVVERSLERQVRHSLCGEVQRFLVDDLGLTLPRRKVIVAIEVEVEDAGGIYNTEAAAQRLVRQAVQAVEGQGSARLRSLADVAAAEQRRVAAVTESDDE